MSGHPCKIACAGGYILLLAANLFAAGDWTPIPGGRQKPLTVPSQGKPGFHVLPPQETGIFFTNALAQSRHITNQILLNGSGLAAGDIDGDGNCDLYFCGLDGSNKLYRNLGDWKFEDITEKAGVALAELDATGVALADLDGDGDLDVIVNSVGGGTHILLNDGKGHFTRKAILNQKRGGMSLALADIDGDGDLDLYVANYRTVTLRDQPNTHFTVSTVDGKPTVTAVDGRPVTDPDLADRFNYRITMTEKGGTFAHDENGEPDAIFLNDGKGNFTPLSFTSGAFLDEQGQPLKKPPLDWGLSVMMRDLNGDGAPDIYVCNDFKSPDRIWINNGKGQFRAAEPLSLRQISFSSMGADFADINRDGFDDILVVDMLSPNHFRRHTQRQEIRPEVIPPGQIENRPQTSRNTLFLNRGDGTFAEIAQYAGVEASDWSWTPIFLDVDLDGYEDILISNGFERDNLNVDALRKIEAAKKQQKLSTFEQLQLRQMFPRLKTPNLALRNLGNLKFTDMSREWGFDTAGVSQGMALADLDNDGDLDVIVNNLNGIAGIYRNECTEPRIAVRLKGIGPNRFGIGARLKVSDGKLTQTQQIVCGGRYLSSDDPMRVFAAPGGPYTIEVKWRSGKQTVISNAAPNFVYELDESAANHPVPLVTKASEPLFEDVSALINHTHSEAAFDDFTQQPLLPYKLSQLGPGVAWADLDGDGWDDLCIGSGAGGRLACFRNDRKGGFTPWDEHSFSDPVTQDQTGLVALRRSNGRDVLLVGGGTNSSGVAQYDFSAHQRSIWPGDNLSEQGASAGPLALGDVSGRGDLDLFIGGRSRAQRYPEPVTSVLQKSKSFLADVGVVSSAVFTDIDGDGAADLVLACEPGSLRVFRNDRGEFSDVTKQWGLAKYTGFWHGVVAGDFDGDGRMDLAASNIGENSRYQRFLANDLRIYYGDLDNNGSVEILEAYRENGRWLPIQPFSTVGAAMPWLRETIPSFTSYAEASFQEIHGERLKNAKEIPITCLQTMVFMNRGNHFEAIPLPPEAQFAPAYALCVADFDGDGKEDLFLSQNLFAVHPDTSRYDAGRGLLLKGNGDGTFAPVSGQESGIKIYGEQRGAAVCDYDGDGRPDLVVTQNGAQTKLYRNLRGKRGIRVRLNGPPGNRSGIGAVLRLKSAMGLGPAREIDAGSGYWSQDSAVQVLHGEHPTEVAVRWPGGQTSTHEIPSGANEVTIDGPTLRAQP